MCDASHPGGIGSAETGEMMDAAKINPASAESARRAPANA
jgi:hypothetical protein